MNLNKKGISQLIVVVLMVVFVVVVGGLIFSFASKTVGEQSQKGGDRATAREICVDEVRIRILDVESSGDKFLVSVENLKQRALNDFLIRFELGDNVEIKKIGQVLGGYESAKVPVFKPSFIPNVLKVIPQIILEEELASASGQAWWLCSNQIVAWEF